MATVYEIVQGLTQAAANAYDGATDKEGKPLKAGLRREEGNPLIDKRVMDGFNVGFHGPYMCIKYHSECTIREVLNKGFEGEIEQRMADIASFLKKEYKAITGNSVSFSPDGEIDIRVENSSRVRSWVLAKQYYKVDSLKEAAEISLPSEDSLENNFRKFLDLGGLGKRAPNDKRPATSGKKEDKKGKK